MSELLSWQVVGQRVAAKMQAHNSAGGRIEVDEVYTIAALDYCSCFKWVLFGLAETPYDDTDPCFGMFPSTLFRPVVEPKAEKQDVARGPLDGLHEFARNPKMPDGTPVRPKKVETV